MSNPETETSETHAISVEVRRLSKILALTAVKGMPQNEQISFLDAAGYQTAEIADMVHTTRGTVSQTLYSMRKGKKQKKTNKKT